MKLTPEQEAFVELVTNAMCTGYLHLTSKTDEVVRASNASRGTNKSARDVLMEVLGDEPRNFIKFRPFEITEIVNALKDLADAEDRKVD